MCSVITGQGDLIFGGVVSNRKFKLFGLEGSELPPHHPPNPPPLPTHSFTETKKSLT